MPNHCTIVTGRPVLQPAGQPDTVHHGYNNNMPGADDTIHLDGNSNVPYKASVFDVVHDHGLSTAFYAGKTRLSICARSYDGANGAPDTVGEDNGRAKIDFVQIVDRIAASNLVSALLTNLDTAPHRYSFLHLTDPDSTGHSAGWGTAAWSNTVRQVDRQLGRILAAIQSNPSLSNHTAVLLSADHGGGGFTARNHTEPEYLTNYTIPFFVWGPGIPAGVDAYLLFGNRADPGTNRLDYSATSQPLRDGDVANVALALLDLPPIPGSTLVPVFVSASYPSLQITRTETGLEVSWPMSDEAFVLETANALPAPQPWQMISDNISTNGTRVIYSPPDVSATKQQFFRLRRTAAP